MSTLSFAGRGILNGLAEGGYPLRVAYDKRVAHTCVDGTAQLDTVYIFAFVARRSPGTTAPVRVETSVLDRNNGEYILSDITLPGLPCTSPTIVVNGQVKNNGARIRVRALDGEVSIFGWYNRSTVSVPPSVRTLVGQLVLAYQIISFSSDDESRIIDVVTPVTFITTSHTTQRRSTATLGSANVGTVKIIVMSGKSPAATSSEGHCTIVPSQSSFPAGEGGPPVGTLTFQDVGDSAILMWSGTLWMLVGTGAVVE